MLVWSVHVPQQRLIVHLWTWVAVCYDAELLKTALGKDTYCDCEQIRNTIWLSRLIRLNLTELF